MKDEFYFDSKALEHMFLKEQRRVKALRRKQYSEKNYLKKRDVTIYVIDQYKDRIIEFLELWYDKYKRKMRDSELKEVATRLNTSYQNLFELQEIFLKRRKLVRSQQLRDYHMHMGTDRARSPSGNLIPRKIGDYLRAAGEYDRGRKGNSGNLKWGRSKQGNYNNNNNWAKSGPVRPGKSTEWGGRSQHGNYKHNTGRNYHRGRTPNGSTISSGKGDYGYKMPIRKSAEAGRRGNTWRLSLIHI